MERPPPTRSSTDTMRSTFPALTISAALGGALLLVGCSPRGSLRMVPIPAAERSGVQQALRCAPLPAAEPARETADGSKEVVLRYPDKNAVAILTVPRGAVSQPTTFT